MFSFWKLLHTFNLLKTASDHHFWATILVSCAILVPIATTSAIAKIAYQEQSWEAVLVLLVTIIQV